MIRIHPSCILALAVLLLANHAAAIPPMAPATTDRVSVTAAPTADADASGYDIRCEIAGGVLSIDRNYIGAVPRSGSLPPGGHYFELHLPGYDDIGFWLTLEKATNYTINFDPAGKIRLFAAKDEVSVSTEPTLKAGQSDLMLSSSIGGATLLMDKVLIGTIPKAGGSPGGLALVATPGSHFLELSAPGYYDLEAWLLFEERTKYTVVLNPARITGFISIDIEPSDASLSLDGGDIGRGLTEVAAGTHSLSIRRFGFVERSLTVVVHERTTSFVSLSLQRAVFTISGLGFSRSVFNPRNSGAPGRTSLDFRATNSGSAMAEIHGSGGELVATLDFPDIATWNQSRTWNGRAADGSVLPDGVYSVRFTARPAPGVPTLPKGPPDGTVELQAEGRIDSTLVIRSFGTVSAVTGLLFMPDPLSQPAGTLAAEASWFEPWNMPQASAFGLSAALSLGGRVTIALHAAAETGDAPVTATDLALSALTTLFGDRSSPAAGAVFLRGSYTSSTSPAVPGARSAVEASFPVSLRLGDFAFALSPGALASFAPGGASFLALARSGLWLEGSSFRAGISGEVPISFATALPSALWPARAALEGRLMLGSTPFVAAAFATAELAPGATPVFGIGIGLGLLF